MSRGIRSGIDKFFDYGIFLETRTIYIGSAETDLSGEESGTDSYMAENAIKALHILDTLAPSGDKQINIVMNNLGGDWYHGMGIFDAIKSCVNYVTIKCYGYCMSMGSIILQAADERIMTKNSRMMIHYGTMGLGETHSKIFTKWAKENERMNTEMENLYLEKIKEKKPRFTRKQLQDLLNFDTLLNAKEALELGLADKILGEEKKK